MNTLYKYVGYDRYYTFNGVIEVLNSYRIPGIHVKVQEKKDFRKALENDVSYVEGYRKVKWWKEDDLIDHFNSVLPGHNFKAGFKLFKDDEIMKRYATEDEMLEYVIGLISMEHDFYRSLLSVKDPKVREEVLWKAIENVQINISSAIKYLPYEFYHKFYYSAIHILHKTSVLFWHFYPI